MLVISFMVIVLLGYFIFNLFLTFTIYSNFGDATTYLNIISKRKPYIIQQEIILREAIFRNNTSRLRKSYFIINQFA